MRENRIATLWRIILILSTQSLNGELNNAALNKRFIHSKVAVQRPFQQGFPVNTPTDGDVRPYFCLITNQGWTKQYIGVDLNNEYTVSYVIVYLPIRFRNRPYLAKYKILVGNKLVDQTSNRFEDYVECMNEFDYGYRKYHNTSTGFIAKCTNEPRGRYVVLVQDDDRNHTLENQQITYYRRKRVYLCEMVVLTYDKLIEASQEPERKHEYMTFDMVKNKLFKVRSHLWNNVTKIYSQKYLGGQWAVKETSIPFAWDQSTNEIFATAIEIEKGRAMALPRELATFLISDHFKTKFSQIEINWYSYLFQDKFSIDTTTKIHWVDCQSLNIYTPDSPTGYIYRPSCENFEPEDVYNEFKSGNHTPILLIHSGWRSDSLKYKDGPFFKLAQLLGVQFLNRVANWNQKAYNTSVFINEKKDYFPIETMLKCANKNRTIFSRFTTLPDFSKSDRDHHFLIENNSDIMLLIRKIVMNYTKDFNKALTENNEGLSIDLSENTFFPRGSLFNLNKLGFAQKLGDNKYIFPMIDKFPGVFLGTSPDSSEIITIINDHPGEIHSLGLYISTGQAFSYEVLHCSNNPQDWSFQIGCQTDRLFNQKRFFRLPLISHNVELVERGEIYTPIGGLIFILNRTHKNGTITIKLKRTLRAPYFNIRDQRTIDDWENRVYENSQVPWTEVSGDAISFCYPTDYVRSLNVSQLTKLTKYHWDRVVKSDITFVGKNWRNFPRQRVVFDVQLTMGYGHSGYPIVGKFDWVPKTLNFLNKNQFHDSDFWGLCHEIGHNHQEKSWTMKLFIETTNNVMVLMNFRYIFNHSLDSGFQNNGILNARKIDNTLELLTSNDARKKISHSDSLLHYFAQLIRHFDYGLIAKAWQRYEVDFTPNNYDQFTMETWIRMLSKVSGYNMVPYHRLWKFDFDKSLLDDETLLSYPCFLPSDWLSNYLSFEIDRIEAVMNVSCQRTVEKIYLPVNLYEGYYEMQPLRVIYLT